MKLGFFSYFDGVALVIFYDFFESFCSGIKDAYSPLQSYIVDDVLGDFDFGGLIFRENDLTSARKKAMFSILFFIGTIWLIAWILVIWKYEILINTMVNDDTDNDDNINY